MTDAKKQGPMDLAPAPMPLTGSVLQVQLEIPTSMAELLHRRHAHATEMASAYVQHYVVENGLRDLVARVLRRRKEAHIRRCSRSRSNHHGGLGTHRSLPAGRVESGHAGPEARSASAI